MYMADDETEKNRMGPHPLGLHVASATQNWAGAAAAFPLFHLGGMQIHPDLKQAADDLRQDMAQYDLQELHIMIMKQAQARLSETLAGITAYQHHAYRRQVPDRPLFARIGTSEIRDYGMDMPQDSPLVIAIPSLVNPAYILDLREGHSFMHALGAGGVRPYLLDWTAPGGEELGFGLEDYILKRLIPLIRMVHHHHNRKIHLLGYCMGGNLALAAAQILQGEEIIESLTLIATPWDFHAGQSPHLPALTEYFLKMTGPDQNRTAIPMNILQLFFFSLDPTLSDRKFRKFSRYAPDDDQTRNFIAIEDWANDGAPLSPKLAKDCLINWYQQNQPQKGQWKIGEQVIDPARIRMPGHIITPRRDRIVPPASAKALQEKLPHFTHTNARGGHVTMIAAENNKEILWQKITSCLK
ncbi:Polyhydroxyalkanoic acid synthase [hydrothermal vent metagenome]|uniref:Polyhydroxyalkanoic acid synthase n=1 Tax=hydrothermal vent metagenome TaxID=652676 RepID=A0A3B0SVY1_9ZZZZ